jgi:hypothetical protein
VALHPARSAQIVIGCFHPLQSLVEQILGERGVNLLMLRQASNLAHNMFDDMSFTEVVWDDEGALFDEMHCTDVIWDEETHHGFDSHGLLQHHAEAMDNQMQGKEKLAQSGDYYDERKVNIEPDINNLLIHVNDHFSMLVIGADSRRSDVVWDEDMLSDLDTHGGLLQLLACCKDDELNQDRDTPFLLGLGMDQVDEMLASPSSLGMNEDLPSVPETHGSLLQQVAWDRKHFAYEMCTLIAEMVLEDVLTDVGNLAFSIDSSMQISDQPSKYALVIDAYLLKTQYKKPYISISQWDPGIWCKGTMAHEQQQLEIYRMFEKQWDSVILKWFRNPFVLLQSCNGEDLNEQGTVPVNDIFDVLAAGQELNFGNVTLIIYGGCQGAMGLQVLFAELHPWHHNVFTSIELAIQSWRINGFSPGSCKLNRQSILVATNLQFNYKASKFVSFTDTYQIYKNTCICIGELEPASWRDTCWLPEISHANVSTLASEEIDNMLFQVGDFHPGESEQLELYMITLIQWDLGPVEFYKSNCRCPAAELIGWC